jgi:L-iditol 2-dehydrogenase
VLAGDGVFGNLLVLGDFVGGSYEYDPYSIEAKEGRQSEAPGVKPYETQWEDGYYGRYDGCADYLVQSQESIYKFKNRIRPSEAGFLEPLATVINGLKKLAIKETDTVVIIGGGTMGILNALVAKRAGARVIVSEMMEKKVKVAEELGLEVIDGSKVDPIEEVMKRTDNRGADTVIVAVGLTVANQQAFKMLKTLHGKVLMFAAGYPAPDLGVDTNKIHYGKMSIYGTFAGDYEDFNESARLLGEKLIDVSALVDKEFKFEDILQAFEEAVKPGGYRTTVIM